MSTNLVHVPCNLNSTVNNRQFKHTILWNGIIDNLKQTLCEIQLSTGSRQLRKQHSRFVAVSQFVNIVNFNSSTAYSSSGSNRVSSSGEENDSIIVFTGTQGVDIIYNYLTSNHEALHLERQVTREKVVKLCQSIMDSGSFEPANRTSARFDDTSLKYYRFKATADMLSMAKASIQAPCVTRSTSKLKSISEKIRSKSNTRDILVNKENSGDDPKKIKEVMTTHENRENQPSHTRTTKATCDIKQKLSSMRRSSTINGFHSLEDKPLHLRTGLSTCQANSDKEPNCGLKESKKIKLLSNITQTISSGGDILTSPIKKLLIRDKSNNDLHLKSELKPKSYKLSNELLVTRQITRELIVEKLSTLIDLPVIEHLLLSEEHKEPIPVKKAELAILSQSFNISKAESQEEWRKSLLECLEFVNWDKREQEKTSENAKTRVESLMTITSHLTKSSPSLNLYENNSSNPKEDNSPHTILVLMKDRELYTLLKDYYTQALCFMNDSFQTVLRNVLSLIRKNQYNQALEILNLGTLLLTKRRQAELKRLFKCLYLTAVCPDAPRLADKPNNTIVLNDFAPVLISSQLISHEESRLLFNLMMNNFDQLFNLNASIEDSVNKRKLLIEKFGLEEGMPLEKTYCQRVTSQEYLNDGQKQTERSLVNLINHIIDDPKITLKQKKLKLKALKQIHPEVYDNYFSSYF